MLLGRIAARFWSADTVAKKRTTFRTIIKQQQSLQQVQKEKESLAKGRPYQEHPVLAACTADAYNFNALLPVLQRHFRLSPFICDEVLHVEIPPLSAGTQHLSLPAGEIFFFKHGSFVFWSDGGTNCDSDLTSDALLEVKKSLIPFLKPFEESPHKLIDMEEMSYRFQASNAGIIDDVIVLPHPQAESVSSTKDKLAFSNGLADSVKLGVLEQLLDELIDKIRNVPGAFQTGGRVLVSRRQVLRLLGDLMQFRAQLNLNSDLLDTPDVYWSEPRLEELYLRMSRVLETRRRTAILNKKLDYAKETAQMLSDHLSEKHGLKLEWGIIILIAVEVAFETVHLLEKFM